MSNRQSGSKLHRRTLIQALGLGAGSLAFHSWGAGFPQALAQMPSRAKRIVFFVTSHGTVYDNWRMRPQGQGEDVDFEFDLQGLQQDQFSSILAPLHGLREHLLIIDGVANCAGRVLGLNEHDMGHASILTGQLPREVPGALAQSQGASLDQVLAGSLPNPGPFASLEYGIGGQSPCFDTSGAAIPMTGEPWQAHQRLFGGVAPGAGGTPTNAEHIQAGQASVLDLVGQRYAALQTRLSARDRQKLEQHRALVFDLEQSLKNLQMISCEATASPSGRPAWDAAEWPRWHEDVYFGLSAVALGCGLTKVITIRHDQIPTATVGVGPGDLHNDLAHHTHTNAHAKTVMTRYHTHQAQAFARLVESLANIPHDTGTLLDDTIVVWTNELATGNHLMTDIPLVVAGGKNVLRLGRYVRYAPTHVMQAPWSTPRVGPAHNKFLTTLAQAMGLTNNSFGVTQIPAAGGGQIATTGTLPGLAR